MGKFKERLTITFTASLQEWFLRDEDIVQGTVALSIDRDYRDGENRIFMNVSLKHYPTIEGGWKSHYVMTTASGRHFKLDADNQYRGESHASLV